ncbi:MAG: hypothetical protein JSR33_00175 [Proteobacteria bacterium]|nr:hypothetical protein [Pseudomonadota bacterium]
MKTAYIQFFKAIKVLHFILTNNQEAQVPANLEQFLDNLLITDEHYFLILDNLILITNYILTHSALFAKNFSKDQHVFIHIHKNQTKSVFHSQIIKPNSGEYLLVISCRRKIFNWVQEGFSKQATKSLILKVNGARMQWMLGVEAVSLDESDIKGLIHEARLTNLVNSVHVQKVIEGASYVDKKGMTRKTLISEFIGAVNLKHLIKNNFLNFVFNFFLCYGCFVALASLHQQSVVHNDLNDENILLITDNKINGLLRPVIADLGSGQKYTTNQLDAFKIAAAADLRKLAYQLFLLLKNSYAITDSNYKIKINMLSEIMKKVHLSVIDKQAEDILKQLDQLIKEMLKEGVPQLVQIVHLIGLYYQRFQDEIKELKPKEKPKDFSTQEGRLTHNLMVNLPTKLENAFSKTESTFEQRTAVGITV